MKRNNVVSLNKVVSASADAFIAYGTNNQELILRFHGNPGHVLDRTPHTCFIGTDETGRVATCRQGRKKNRPDKQWNDYIFPSGGWTELPWWANINHCSVMWLKAFISCCCCRSSSITHLSILHLSLELNPWPFSEKTTKLHHQSHGA